MLPRPGTSAVDRPARDHAARVVASLIDRTLAWDRVVAELGPYAGRDRGVSVIHAELRSVAAEEGTERENDAELRSILERTRAFLRSGVRYRWHHRGPVEIVGAYLGGAALAWMVVACGALFLGPSHEAVIAGALGALLLMVVLASAMAVALVRRLWWRYTARVEGADHRFWPFFTEDEYHAARDVAP